MRTSFNYRDYSPGHAERLSFIRQARGLGFDIADIRSLLALGADPDQDCGHVDQLATGHLRAVTEGRPAALADSSRRNPEPGTWFAFYLNWSKA